MSMKCISPLTTLLYRKTEVCRCIHNFLIFDPKHTLLGLVEAVLTCTHYVCFSEIEKIKNKKKKEIKIKKIPMKFQFFSSKVFVYILHGQVIVMTTTRNGNLFIPPLSVCIVSFYKNLLSLHIKE